ncbi:MAG: OmpA family protein, partial [Tagaea sp.]|nr:OmpA family protein [Tagaea sp.]
MKILAAAAALVLLAACESGTNNTGGVSGTGGAPVLANPPGGSAGQGGVNQGTLGGRGGAAAGSQEDLQQRVGDRIFFASDRSDLTPEGRRTVEGWAGWLRQNPGVSATIEGHADERGTREYNLALGERRAAAA